MKYLLALIIGVLFWLGYTDVLDGHWVRYVFCFLAGLVLMMSLMRSK